MRLLDRSTSRLPQPWRTIVDWGITIAFAIVLVLVFEAEIAKPYRIPSSSMETTLHCAEPGPECLGASADRVIANRLAYDFRSPHRGEIVVFQAPARAATPPPDGCGQGGTYVKRIVGLPGETVHEDSAGFIWIDGRKLSEPYVAPAARSTDVAQRGRTWHVPSGSYFMLGDNRGFSCDSRTWGSVPRSNLVGPIILRYWPLDRITGF